MIEVTTQSPGEECPPTLPTLNGRPPAWLYLNLIWLLAIHAWACLLAWSLGRVRECWPPVTDLLKLAGRLVLWPRGDSSSNKLGWAGLPVADTDWDFTSVWLKDLNTFSVPLNHHHLVVDGVQDLLGHSTHLTVRVSLHHNQSSYNPPYLRLWHSCLCGQVPQPNRNTTVSQPDSLSIPCIHRHLSSLWPGQLQAMEWLPARLLCYPVTRWWVST